MIMEKMSQKQNRLTSADDNKSPGGASDRGINSLLTSVSASRIKEGPYLYKRYEEQYRSTMVMTQQEEYKKALEDRRKFVRDISLSIQDLRVHKEEYLVQLKSKQAEKS